MILVAHLKDNTPHLLSVCLPIPVMGMGRHMLYALCAYRGSMSLHDRLIL
nr:MAG TPA: hypothetical protein [Caudoviricetes sp.]